MKTFEANQVENLVRYVLTLKNCIVQQKETGVTLSVFEEFSEQDKRTVVGQFCARRRGPFNVYSK